MATPYSDLTDNASTSRNSSGQDHLDIKVHHLPDFCDKATHSQHSSVQSSSDTGHQHHPGTINHGADTTNQTSVQVTDESLTVNRKWKVENDLGYMMRLSETPSCLVPVAKWTLTILMGVAITLVLVASKLSFVTLSMAFNTTKPGTRSGTLDESNTTQFLVIYLVTAVPNLLLFLRATWYGLLDSHQPWPRASAILCCFVVGTLEPLGLSILALKMLPDFSLSEGVMIMSTVITLSVLVEAVIYLRREGLTYVGLAMVAACVFAIAGLAIAVYAVNKKMSTSSEYVQEVVHALVALTCLNVAWMPRLLNKISLTREQPNHQTIEPHPLIQNINQVPTEVILSRDRKDSNPETTEPTRAMRDTSPQYISDATWKSSFILYGLKSVNTLLFSFIFFYLDSICVHENFSDVAHAAFIRAWDFLPENLKPYTWLAFGINLVGSLACYFMAFVASHTNMQRGCLGFPFLMCMPLTVLLSAVGPVCEFFVGYDDICRNCTTPWYYVMVATVLITVAQLIAFGRHVFRRDKIYLKKEEKLFWVPGYNGAILDAWLVLDKRKSITHGGVTAQYADGPRNTRVFMCTTMYREDESEMRQLLESLARISDIRDSSKKFESHIIFDGGVRLKKPSEFSLILISLLEETLGVTPQEATKIITPYGMKLSWTLKSQMKFNIHLKDNVLVKNKKRWSQVMYMSYVLDLHTDPGNIDQTYILTTDADVNFTAHSVEALLDLMCRDHSVGAVCARTHPIGSGPLVWYQIFEYAAGHWFQKSAEHVLGSVLCAPGCFSVYRCRALFDVLPKYCKKVESAFDFLTKDMGEDRWLCTLLVQSGWKIEYCAAAENSTNCPSDFEEFFKQRRRWIASTLANLMLIIQEWKYIALFNHNVSLVFLIYQALLLVSTIISPSTVILVVAGGLYFAWNVDPVATIMIQVILCVLFSLACIFTLPRIHLTLAKFYTFLYAVVMCAVAVGTAEQIVDDLTVEKEPRPNNTTLTPILTSTHSTPSQHISVDMPVSVTTVYFALLATMFLVTGLLHPREITCLLHGICFLLCIPSAYLVLMVYSICQLTDSSWGTREESTTSTSSSKKLYEVAKKAFFTIFCFSETIPGDGGNKRRGNKDEREKQQVLRVEDNYTDTFSREDYPAPSVEDNQVMSVEDWLPVGFTVRFFEVFKAHGFENTLFIKNLTEPDLHKMGITKTGHVRFLLGRAAQLPAYEIESNVPTNAGGWLPAIGLSQYLSNFRRSFIWTPKQMEILKRFGRDEIIKELGITMEGHIKRLLEAITMLRDPTDTQQRAIQVRQAIGKIHLTDIDQPELQFWKSLKERCLEPDLKAFGVDDEVKAKLVKLRNRWLMTIAVSNTLWLILISTLATKAKLNVLGANPVGFAFLIIFGVLFLTQFLAMFVHRLSTLSHYIARAPYTFGKLGQTERANISQIQIQGNNVDNVENGHASRHEQEATNRSSQARATTSCTSSSSSLFNGIEQHKPITENTPLLANTHSSQRKKYR